MPRHGDNYEKSGGRIAAPADDFSLTATRGRRTRSNCLSARGDRIITAAHRTVGLYRGRSGIDRVLEVSGGVSWLISWPRKKPITF
jgi:hypothetical protein